MPGGAPSDGFPAGALCVVLVALGVLLLIRGQDPRVGSVAVESVYLPLAAGCDCAPDSAGTRLVELRATVQVFETILPDVMQTAAELYHRSLTPAATCGVVPTPTVLCRRCRGDADCDSGYFCKSCGVCYEVCVRAASPNGDCNLCLNSGK